MCPTPSAPSSLPRFSLFGLPPLSRGAHRVSLVPDGSLFTCHARVPRRTLWILTTPFRDGSLVVSSTTLTASSSAIAVSRLHTASGVTTPCGLQSSLSTLHALRSGKPRQGLLCNRVGRVSAYLHARKTRYWWMVNPFQIKTFLNLLVKDHSTRIVKLSKTY